MFPPDPALLLPPRYGVASSVACAMPRLDRNGNLSPRPTRPLSSP